jgi:hypothetical protein
MAAESTIGKSKRPTNFRSFWDKELDALIKSRRIANQLKRIHDKSRPKMLLKRDFNINLFR